MQESKKPQGTKSQKGNTLLKSIITLIVTLLLGTTAWTGVQENASNDNNYSTNTNQTLNTESNNNLTNDTTDNTLDNIQSNTSGNNNSNDNQVTSEDNNSNDNQVTSEDNNSNDDQATSEDTTTNDGQANNSQNNNVAKTEDEEKETEESTLTFRNQKLLNSHYEKHGKEMGFASAKEYEKAAARVVTNQDALHKTEAEDGDDVYYIESTNEFVVVSKDGYLRTYFYPSDGLDYYNRQ